MIERNPSMDVVTLRLAAAADLPNILAILADAGLMTQGVGEHIDGFVVAWEGGRLVGTAGLEVYGAAALLRSVAVAPSFRGRGLGKRLVSETLAAARRRGVQEVGLLTEDAGPFFRRLGFRETTRERIDPRLLASREFSDPCCAGAVTMTLNLEEEDHHE